MIFGGSAFGQTCYGGIPWPRVVVPPTLPEVVLPEGVGGGAPGIHRKAYSRLQSVYIDYVRRQKRFDEEFARLDDLEAEARPRVVVRPVRLPPKISKRF